MGLGGGRRPLRCLNLVQEGGHVECLWHSWTVIPKELINHLRVGGRGGGGREMEKGGKEGEGEGGRDGRTE